MSDVEVKDEYKSRKSKKGTSKTTVPETSSSKWTRSVFYPADTPRTDGLRLEPGWNEVPIANGNELVKRGICLDNEPGGNA